MSSAHSMNARKCVHAQRPYPCQSFAMNEARSKEEEKERQERQFKTKQKFKKLIRQKTLTFLMIKLGTLMANHTCQCLEIQRNDFRYIYNHETKTCANQHETQPCQSLNIFRFSANNSKTNLKFRKSFPLVFKACQGKTIDI